MRATGSWAKVNYSETRLGGGVGRNGVAFPGGLDLNTPSLALQPGALRDVLNFECSISGGYGRIGGYERVDGRASPSDATYAIVQVSSFTNVPSTGQTLTQAVSGSTGTIIAINNASGAYYVVVTQVSSAFDYTHAVSVGATPIGTAITPVIALTSLLNAQYLALAADVYRALIGAVPGEGNVLGVVQMVFSSTDYVYAFRANVGSTAVHLYKTSGSGWTLVPFYNVVNFSAGGASEPAEGTTLTQGAVTATIKRVMTRTGSWSGSTAAGGLVISNPSGGNFAAGAATIGAINVTLTAIQTAITFAIGGRFEFVKCNFSGSSASRRIYGVDGANKAFEFDGDVLCPITTGLSTDTPQHIAFHKNFLFLSMNSSILYPEAGYPFRWATGGEIAAGDVVSGMLSLPGDQTSAAMGVYLRNSTSILYGTGPSTFNYVLLNTGVGALPYSVQNLFDTFLFDDLGVVSLRTSLNYGNFVSSTLTSAITPFVLQERSKLTASCVQRLKSQYRAFFSDGYGLWLTMINQQYLGACVVLFPDIVYCVDEGETSIGDEVSYFGSADGYVYQLDVGTSFDGEDIEAYIMPAWDPIRSPRVLKRFRAASVEMQGNSYAAISFGYALGYGSTDIMQADPVSQASGFSSTPFWDSFVWDNFFWDGRTLFPTDVSIGGTAENIQPVIRVGTNYIAAFNINSIIYHYTPRRGMRV